MPQGRQVVFQLSGVTRSYRVGATEIHALRGVDLELVAGELVVLLGASGSGKSTLVNIMGGLDRPTAGVVRYHELDLVSASDAELTRFRRNSVGFVFQFYNLVPGLTALENVQLVTELAPAPMPAAEALERLGLAARMDHFPAQLSGGEQQRVAIARAIAKRPEVLLCDEPTGALDCETGVIVLDALERANRDLGTTTVIITHNAVIAGMADRVIRLSNGRISSIEANTMREPPSALRW
ncbi:MAG: transporter related protein [Proteobacteria bacterium]|nr:transporter related protein [Pseudomonadota bacterium]